MNSEIIFYRPKAKGHGATFRQECLIKYLIKKSEIIHIITLEKEKFHIEGKYNVRNLIFNKLARKVSILRWIFLLLTTFFLISNLRNKSIKLIAFSDYESIIFRLALSILEIKHMISKNLIKKNIKEKPKFEIIFFSRGDIVEIFKTNHPKINFIKNLIINISISYYKKIQLLGILSSSRYVVQMDFLKNTINSRFSIAKEIDVISNNIIYPKININSNSNNNKLTKKNFPFNSQITIGFAAPLFLRVKSLDIFIKICNELNSNFPIKVITAGSGVDELYFTSKIRKIIGEDNYLHLGWLDNLNIFFEKIDILIIPSRYDSCPNFLLEAINIPNIRIIASDIPAHREILMQNDLLFPLENFKEINYKFKKIILMKNERYKSYINKVKEKYTFNWEDEIYKVINKT